MTGTGYRTEQISRDISVYTLQGIGEKKQVKEQVEDHRFQCKEEYTAHRLLNRKVVIQVIGYRLQ